MRLKWKFCGSLWVQNYFYLLFHFYSSSRISISQWMCALSRSRDQKKKIGILLHTYLGNASIEHIHACIDRGGSITSPPVQQSDWHDNSQTCRQRLIDWCMDGWMAWSVRVVSDRLLTWTSPQIMHLFFWMEARKRSDFFVEFKGFRCLLCASLLLSSLVTSFVLTTNK